MQLTPEQRAADEGLRAAIDEVCRTFGLVSDNAIVADWIIVGAAQTISDDGDRTQMFTTMPGGTMPHYRLIGLLRTALASLEHDAISQD